MKSARSSRGRFRSSIIDIILDTPELGITPKVSSLNIAHRVTRLTHHNCFLDGPYLVSHWQLMLKNYSPHSQGDVRSPDAMYRSPVLKKAMELLYTAHPWRSAIKFAWYKELSRITPDYKVTPPIAFVAFVASAVSYFLSATPITDHYFQYRNALDCLVTGVDETVPFNEAGYSQIFADLYDLIEDDFSHPDHGEVVRQNIRSLVEDVTL